MEQAERAVSQEGEQRGEDGGSDVNEQPAAQGGGTEETREEGLQETSAGAAQETHKEGSQETRMGSPDGQQCCGNTWGLRGL